jgi:hypothetical protein
VSQRPVQVPHVVVHLVVVMVAAAAVRMCHLMTMVIMTVMK